MMKKGIRLLATAAIVAGTAASVLPIQSASAATQAVMVFSLPATVTNDLYFPVVGGAPATLTKFSFGSDTPTTGQKVCVAVHSVNSADSDCELQASGFVRTGAANLGPYCGWSKGDGQVAKVNINGNVLPASGIFIEWPQSAGTVLPLTYKAGTNASGAVVGVGAVQTTGAAPGTCGINGATNTFQVNGFSALNG